MKKIVSLLLTLAMLALMAFSLVSCGAPKDGGAEISVYLGNEIYDFDPTDYYVDSNAEQVMRLLFEPLFNYTEKGKLECAAAEKYVVDENKREIVITLRESYWSNNSRVKAADFVYAWCEKLLNANYPNPAAALLYDIENAAQAKSGLVSPSDIKVEATDIYELTITYREGADYNRLLKNLASLATAPIRQADVELAPTYWSKFANSASTNGPFKIRKYSNASGELVLERNKGYHQALDVVNYTAQVTPGQLVGFVTPFGEEIALSYSDIAEKTVFYMQDAPLADRSANAASKVKDDTSVYTYVFNTEREMFADARVRLALSMVIDREAIVEAVTFGKAADGFLPDVSGGSDKALIKTTSDDAAMSEAKSLIKAAGFEGKLSFTLSVADDEESRAVAEIVVAAWKELGCNVKVDYLAGVDTTIGVDPDTVTFSDSEIQAIVKDASYGDRNFDVIAVDWQTYSADPFVALAAFTSDINGCGKDFTAQAARTNISGWAATAYDQLVTKAFKAEGEERAALLEEAEAALCEAMPVIPLYFNQTFVFSSPDLSGFTYDGLGNVFFNKVRQKNYEEYLEKE